MPRRFVVSLASFFVAPGLAACAALADLPVYEDRRPDGGSSAVRDARSEVPADLDGVAPEDADALVEAADAPDAPPLIDDLGCNGDASVGLLGHWRMDEGTGTVVGDCSPSPINGAFVGTGTTWVAGRRGAFALAFDGNGHVGLGDPARLHLTGAITATAWINVASFAQNGRIISKGGGPGNRGWDLNVESNGVVTFQISIDGTLSISAESAVLPTGVWRHVAGVYDPGIAVRLYVSGKQVDAKLGGIPAVQRDGLQGVDIAHRQGDDCCRFKGRIDDVRVYGRVLSDAEIARIAAQ